MLAGGRSVRVEDGAFGAGVWTQWEEERRGHARRSARRPPGRGHARTDAGGAGPRLVGT